MTQKEWVKNRLEKYGKVTRNEALRKHITRLGAIIYTLKKEKGYMYKTRYTRFNTDYEYILICDNKS